MTTLALPSRLYPLRPHVTQLSYANSPHRFNVVPAGRRSGKTERAKRRLVLRALQTERLRHGEAPRYFAGAPTRDQAKRIFWADLKTMTKPFWLGAPSESELTIRLVNGAEIVVLGLDKPERIEGSPWDGGLLDEYANIKRSAWGENVRPALADRNGWCDLLGVPEGRNHYYDRYEFARAEMQERGDASEWGAFTWKSAEILPPEEIEAARRDLDRQTFEQEYEASFLNFSGRAYYGFCDANKLPVQKLYDPSKPLILCFDFNVEPGVAAVIQEIRVATLDRVATCVIGEVYIERNSTTPAVCRRILEDWGAHTGVIEVYGDASGGARGTAQVAGSDWDLVRDLLTKGDGERPGFGTHRVRFDIPSANPPERVRVNAMNTRICNGTGQRHLFVDGVAAPHVVKDLEGVTVLAGGSGELDKKKDKRLTHISDGVGYYVVHRFPTGASTATVSTYDIG